MKLIKISLIAAVIATGVYAEEKSEIGVSANVSMTSNYLWRGMTQTNDLPAIQGGFDLEYKGLYAGTWGSNIDFGDSASMEADIYAGYAGEASGIGYDLGFVQFVYPGAMEADNFAEAYAGVSYDFGVVSAGLKYSLGVKTNSVDATDNIEATLSAGLPQDTTLDIAVGSYTDVGTYYSASLSKSYAKLDFSVAYSGIMAEDSANDESNLVLSVGTSF